MLQFDMDALAAALEDEKTGSSKDAQMHADYLKNLRDELQPALNQWLQNKSIDKTPLVKKVSIQMIIDKRKCSFLTALTYMNYLLNSPEKVDAFIEGRIFRRDRVRFGRNGG